MSSFVGQPFTLNCYSETSDSINDLAVILENYFVNGLEFFLLSKVDRISISFINDKIILESLSEL